MDLEQALAALKLQLSKLTLAEGKVSDIRVGEGDDALSLDDLFGIVDKGLKEHATAKDGTAADVLRLTRENEVLTAKAADAAANATKSENEQVLAAQQKLAEADAKTANYKARYEKSVILSSGRDKLDAMGVRPENRKTALALLNMDLAGVQVGDDDSVSGLDVKFAALAKEHVTTFAKAATGKVEGDGGGEADDNGGTPTKDGTTGTGDEGDKYSSQLEAAFGLTADA